MSVNGVIRKAAYDVEPDDIIEIAFGERAVKVRVLSVDEIARKDAAKEMFEQL